MPGSAFRTTARVKEDDLLRYPSPGLCVQIGPHATITEPTDPASDLDGTQFSVLTRMGLHQVQVTPGLYSHNNFFFSILFPSAFGDNPQSTLLPLRAVSCCPQPWMTIMMGLAPHGLLLQGNYFASR